MIGQDGGRQAGRRDVEPLDRRQHADRRRDHAVADEQARAGHQRPEQHAGAAVLAVMQEAVEGEDAALAVVLRAQHKERIFDRDDQGQGPDDQRHGAERVLRRPPGRDAKDLVHRVKRRRPDVAVDHAERPERQRPDAALRRVAAVARGDVDGTGRFDEDGHRRFNTGTVHG